MTPATGFPTWLRDRLIEAGILTPQGLSRRAKPMLHRTCRQLVIAGFDNDTCAFDAWTEPAPLTPHGELAALLDERRTYDLDGERLYRRDQASIPGRPPSPRRTVLAEHRCHSPLPVDWLETSTPSAPTTEAEPF